jgi:5S rRNA maturation endonuclease (ribonuclease M5)
MPSPICLEQDGVKELNSKHLTVNASKYYELDDWKKKNKGSHDPDFSAVCHKTNTKYRVSQLLNEKIFPPLEKRGIKNVTSYVASVSSRREECLILDEQGNLVPQDPGEVIPLSDLASDHPAIEYLVNRGYNIASLEKQFNCGYCVAEAPENPSKGIYYKKLPRGFKDTSQGRIIFYSLMHGVQVGWQARILERVNADGIKEFWHPYENIWVPMEYKNEDTGKWTPLPNIEIKTDKLSVLWGYSKYKTAFGMARNETIMGYDAAIEFNKYMKLKKPVVFLVEGPLDAARLGPGACALLGKHLSDKQADLLSRRFKKVIVIMDNDVAGKEAKEKIKTKMSTRPVETLFLDLPYGFKDIGEMDTISAMNFAYKYI